MSKNDQSPKHPEPLSGTEIAQRIADNLNRHTAAHSPGPMGVPAKTVHPKMPEDWAQRVVDNLNRRTAKKPWRPSSS